MDVALEVLNRVFSSYRLRLNWGKGKSEVLIRLVGNKAEARDVWARHRDHEGSFSSISTESTFWMPPRISLRGCPLGGWLVRLSVNLLVTHFFLQ